VVDRIEVGDHCRCSKIVHDRDTKYTITSERSSRPMAVRWRLGRAYAKADALLMTMTAGKLTSQLP
jgi:hypothetical protein